jgi:hypothetical protein
VQQEKSRARRHDSIYFLQWCRAIIIGLHCFIVKFRR